MADDTTPTPNGAGESPSAPERTPDRPESARDTLREVMAEQTGQDRPAEERDENREEAAPKAGDDRPRDEHGRFAPRTQAAEGAAPAVSTEAAPADKPAETVEPLQHWAEDLKADFRSWPAGAQASFLKRHKAIENAHAERTREVAPVLEALSAEPTRKYLAHLTTEVYPGSNAGQLIGGLIQVEQVLRYGTPEQKTAQALALLRDYKIQLPSTSGAGPSPAKGGPVTPELQTMQQELAQVKNALVSRERAEAAARQQTLTQDIQTFAEAKDASGNLLHPFLEEVVGDMAALAQVEKAAGRPPRLDDLYRKAIRMNDAVFAKVQEAEKAASAAAERAKAAERVAKAQAQSRGLPPGSPAERPRSVDGPARDTVREAYYEQVSR